MNYKKCNPVQLQIFLSWALMFLPFAGSDLVRAQSIKGDFKSAQHNFSVETITNRSGIVWGFDFIPDGSIVFSERSGKLGVYNPKSGTTTMISGLPAVYAKGQGGLLDVAVHPNHKENGWVYVTYSKSSSGGPTTALARIKIAAKGQIKSTVVSVEELFVAKASSPETRHFGSRVVFDGKGNLYLSIGDRGQRDEAQNLQSHQGKILRLKDDGSIPEDNPFTKRKDAYPEIWSYGHRNPQGLHLDPDQDQLWEVEMGPKGGDELNLIRKGANYGWPVITYGREYHGPKLAKGRKRKVWSNQLSTGFRRSLLQV